MGKHKPKKIKRRNKIYLYISPLIILMALLFILQQDNGKHLETENKNLIIPVPAKTIQTGVKLSKENIIYIEWPKRNLQPSHVKTEQELVGAYASTNLAEYTPIPITSISQKEITNNTVAEKIPKGMRAITIKVDTESAVEGWARTGNQVDVILVRTLNKKELDAIVVAENVQILSAGRSTKPLSNSDVAPKAPTTVTLLVNQKEALAIKAAAKAGKLTFSLRGKNDNTPTKFTKVNQQELFKQKTKRKNLSFRDAFVRDDQGNLYILNENSRWVRAKKLPEQFKNTTKKILRTDG